MWEYNQTDSLTHTGVLGMKWGHRKAARIDRAIGRIETMRKNNKNDYAQMKKESAEMYKGKDKKLAKANANDKALYTTSEVANRFALARQNAKKDKAYKDSKEYRQAKADFGKQRSQQMIYGTYGHQRIESLKNQGYTEKAAKGRTIAEELGASVVVGGALTLAAYLKNKG